MINTNDILVAFRPNDWYYDPVILKIFSKYKNFEFQYFNEGLLINYFFLCRFLKYASKVYVKDINVEEIMRMLVKHRIGRPRKVISLLNMTDKIDLANYGTKIIVSELSTLIIDLSVSLEQIYGEIDPKARNQIKKAQKEEVEIKTVFEPVIFDRWWDLYLSTAHRGGFRTHSKEMIVELLLSQKARLFTANHSNQILAGAIILVNKYPVYWLGASDKGVSTLNGPTLLQWEIIKWAKNENYLLYDMGGIVKNQQHGPSRFKKAFGGINVDYFEYTHKSMILEISNKLKNYK